MISARVENNFSDLVTFFEALKMLSFSRPALGNKQYIKSVKIGASLVVVTLVTFSPLVYAVVAETSISGYIHFVIYINNFANFFVYFWIDERFRKAVLKDFGYEVQPTLNIYVLPQLINRIPSLDRQNSDYI